MYKVFVENLEFYGYHGVSPEERKIGHRYLVSCSVTVHGKATETDEVSDTVDYGALALLLQKVGTSTQFSTVERLADEMCSEIFAAFSLVSEISLRAGKIAPPMAVVADEAGVEVFVTR